MSQRPQTRRRYSLHQTAKVRKLRTDLGKNIRFYRKKRGLTQAALADLTGLSQASICHTEQGKRETTMAEVIFISGALDVDPLDLIPQTNGVNQADALRQLCDILDVFFAALEGGSLTPENRELIDASIAAYKRVQRQLT